MKFSIRDMNIMLLSIFDCCENQRRDCHTFVTDVNKIPVFVYHGVCYICKVCTLRYGVQVGRLVSLKFFVTETQSSLPLGLRIVECSGWGSGGTKLCEFLRQRRCEAVKFKCS